MATANDVHRQHGPYTPHSLSDLTAGMAAATTEAPRGETVPILSDPESAVYQADQLRGLLCLAQPPTSVRTTTAPERTTASKNKTQEEEEKPEAQAVEVFELADAEYSLLLERAVIEEGPIVLLHGEQLPSRRVRAFIQAAYPPRSLNHAQTCDATECRLSSNEAGSASPSTPRSTKPLPPSQSQTQSQLQATASVLRTTELLELILLHLDLKSRIASAPRVSRFWSETLNHSPMLRKASFFEADHSLETEPGERPYINPLLREAFGDQFFNLSDCHADKYPFRRAEYFWKLPWSPQALPCLKARTGSVLNVDPSCRQRSFTRAGASWRRMLVSQPPPPFLGFTWLDSFIITAAGYRCLVDFVAPPQKDAGGIDAGVTMGQLYDTVQSLTMQQQKPGLFFRVRWDLTCERLSSEGASAAGEGEGARESTNLVAEFWDDAYFNSSHYGPFSMEATRSVFRCEEAVKPAFGGQAWIQGVDDDAEHHVPANDEFELWEPLEWNP
ncbi:reverse transcriptase domain protein [Purpureocillium lavendulum]|uniref:Reverse transcriptase domain protein n=1 Tax=Purpureocillium lavendulum TaxID=1247861 RepID=A0AB34FK62_9HYPO|nr:reverse transcriptase domain protein [Purpureocillium lavendulum]